MTEKNGLKLVALQCFKVGPLGSYIDTFAAWLSERGYAWSTMRYTQIRIVAKLSRWLYRQQLDVKDLDEQIIAKFLRGLRGPYYFRSGAVPTLRMLLTHLRHSGVITLPTPVIDDSDLGRIARDFEKYLTEERGLSEATFHNYFREIRRFLTDRFGTNSILFSELRYLDITRFVLRYSHIFSRARTKLIVTALRSFFRFLYLRGDVATDLSVAIPPVANWRLSTVPKFISQDQVKLLLQSCDQNTIVGQRDYTVLLLMARLGLRAKEVVTMTLDDIDWEAGVFLIRGKGYRQERLPIPRDVGEALVAYLRHGRPRCLTRRVFIRSRAPRIGFSSSSAIEDIVKRALSRAGLNLAFKGAHLLRHSLATNMLRKGSSLSEIGEILRHRHPDTTQIYAKVDLTALHTLAEPWLGGEI